MKKLYLVITLFHIYSVCIKAVDLSPHKKITTQQPARPRVEEAPLQTIRVTTNDNKERKTNYIFLLFSELVRKRLKKQLVDKILFGYQPLDFKVPISSQDLEKILPILELVTKTLSEIIHKSIHNIDLNDVKFLSTKQQNELQKALIERLSFQNISQENLKLYITIFNTLQAPFIVSIIRGVLLKSTFDLLDKATDEYLVETLKTLNLKEIDELIYYSYLEGYQSLFERIKNIFTISERKKTIVEIIALLKNSHQYKLNNVASIYFELLVSKMVTLKTFSPEFVAAFSDASPGFLFKLIIIFFIALYIELSNLTAFQDIVTLYTSMLEGLFNNQDIGKFFSQYLASLFIRFNDENNKKNAIKAWDSFFSAFQEKINSDFPIIVLLNKSNNPNKEKILKSLNIFKCYLNFIADFLLTNPHNSYGSYEYSKRLPQLFKNQFFMKNFDIIKHNFTNNINSRLIPILNRYGIPNLTMVGINLDSIYKDLSILESIEKQFQSSRLKKIFPERLARFLFSLKFDQEERRKILVGLSIGAAINAGVLLKKVIEYYHNKAKSGA